MRVQSASRPSARVLLLDLLVREQDAYTRVHGLLMPSLTTTEQRVVAEDGESDRARVLVDDRPRATERVALGVRVVHVSHIQTLLRRFGGMLSW